MPSGVETKITTAIPARLDRLPWARFHWLVVIGLGTVWILDGLEVTIVGSMSEALKPGDTGLGLTNFQVGLAGAIYVAGACVGALVFGQLTDRFGRKKLFILTLVMYTIATVLTAFSMNPVWYFACRFLTGAGIGGEYAAINSAIDELIPAKYRGRVDLAVNGTYWGGALLGASGSFLLLNHDLVAQDWGWRIGFFIGPVLGLVIIYVRRHIPESPRWMITHGQSAEAEQIVDDIEASVEARGVRLEQVPDDKAMLVKAKEEIPFRQLLHVFLRQYPDRTFLGVTMMITQSFLYNAIFFTYALVLQNFYHLSESTAALYFLPFAVGNLLGPLLLGHLFDTIGRRKMILSTYLIAGLVLLASAALFEAHLLNAVTHTLFWCVSFFFASAGASSAYLTVSEIFPLEVRGQAISYFFAVAQVVGALGPLLFGALVGDGTARTPLFWGYVLGSGVMIVGGLVAFKFGIDAEGKGLEDVADPLSRVDR